MRNRTIAMLLAGLFYLTTGLQAAEVRKLGSNDLEWATPNQGAATTTTSPGGKTVTKIDAAQVPWRGSVGYLDNLVDGSYDITIKPAAVTGDNTGRIQGFTFGAAGYTDNGYFQDIISKGPVIDVRAYGAAGDGSTDDTAEIQAAINAVKANTDLVSDNTFANPKVIYFPKGTYIISSPLDVYSGTWLEGAGVTSKIQASDSFSGTALVHSAVIAGGDVYVQHLTIRNLSFQSGGSIWAFDATPVTNLTQARFENLTLYTDYGLNLSGYTQNTYIDGVYSYGSLEQLIYLQGNHNLLRNINKEGGTGTTVEPYILIEEHGVGTIVQSAGNRLEHILLEGTASANKSGIKLDGTLRTVIDGFWWEPTTSDGYALRINDSRSVHLRGNLRHLATTDKITIDNNSDVDMEYLDADQSDVPFTDVLSVDNTSNLSIGRVYSRRNSGMGQASKSNIRVGEFVNKSQIASPITGHSIISKQQNRYGGNLFVNPSFEAGIYGWTWSATPSTVSFPASEVGSGLMLNASDFAAGSPHLRQRFTPLPAGWLNRPMTVSFMAKITGTGSIMPYVASTGITTATAYSKVIADAGWTTTSLTFIPQTAAVALDLGIYFVSIDNTTEVWIDEVNLSFGDEGAASGAKFGSLELGTWDAQKTVTFSSAAPTTGTWKAGDLVLNSGIDNVIGWKCTSAGTPGTWKYLQGVLEP